MICRKCGHGLPDVAVFCYMCGAKQALGEKRPRGRARANGMGTAYRRGRTWTAKVRYNPHVVTKDGVMRVVYDTATKGGFARKSDAVAYCPQLKAEAMARGARQERPAMTIAQIYDAWSEGHEGRVSHSTMNCYRAAWKYFAPLHGVNMCDIDLDDLQECVDDCPCGKRTKENMKALAGLLCKYAIPRHQTDLNYAEFIDTGNGEKRSHPAFSAEQVERIRASVGVVPHADLLYCLIYTGFRPTEMFSLRKEDYTGGILYGGIKTAAGKNRAVPVSNKIRPIIEARLQSSSPYIFPKDDGTFLTANYFRKFYFYQALDAIGIQPMDKKDSPDSFVPYSCRHTFANLLKDAPGSDKDKAGLIGHQDYRTTKKHYQSAELDALRKIVSAL